MANVNQLISLLQISLVSLGDLDVCMICISEVGINIRRQLDRYIMPFSRSTSVASLLGPKISSSTRFWLVYGTRCELTSMKPHFQTENSWLPQAALLPCTSRLLVLHRIHQKNVDCDFSQQASWYLLAPWELASRKEEALCWGFWPSVGERH